MFHLFYTPYGAVTKTVHFVLDGIEQETVSTSITGRQQTYIILAQSQGVHTLRVYFEATINGNLARFNELYYEIIWLETLNTIPVIGSSFSKANIMRRACGKPLIGFTLTFHIGKWQKEHQMVDGNQRTFYNESGKRRKIWGRCQRTGGAVLVKIYIADTTPLKDELLYRKLYDSLDADRRSKADHFLFAKDKRLCVAAGALLRAALQEEHVTDYALARHPNGKPYLENERLCFNLSHSGQMVMCALSDTEVGCDVEQKGPFDPALAAYVMTQQDLKRIYQEEAEKRADIFFRLWTLKESYMKATGMGVLLEPRSFGISFRGGGIRAVPYADQREFYFKEYIRDDGYCYSCCCLSDAFPDTMTQVEMNMIL